MAGISGTNYSNNHMLSIQNKFSQFQKDFQQLGQDLQTGNLTAAQQDFRILQQLAPQASSTSSTQSTSPIAQDFNQLSTDLKSGNITAAQQDYAKIQQDFQNGQIHRPHHHHRGWGVPQSQFSQLFSELGQSLEAGNLTSAQQAYATMQQDFPQLAEINTLNSTQQSSTALSVTA